MEGVRTASHHIRRASVGELRALGLSGDLLRVVIYIHRPRVPVRILLIREAIIRHRVPRLPLQPQPLRQRAIDPEWRWWSDRAIGERTGAGKSTVNDLRRKLEQEDLSVRTRTDSRIDGQRLAKRGGTVYAMQTGNIGKGRTRPTKRLVPWSDGLYLRQDLVERVEAYRAKHGVSIRDLVEQALEWRLTQGDPFSDEPGEA